MAHHGIVDMYVGTTVDSVAGLSATNIRHFANPQELSIKPKTNSEQAWGGNIQIDQAIMFESGDIQIGTYDLTAQDIAFLLNQYLPANGGVVANAEDEGEYKCIFYKSPLRRKKADGTRVNRYGWVYKTQFAPPDDSMKTLAGKPDLSQTPTISGTALATLYEYTNAKGETLHPWYYFVDDDDPNCPANIEEIWNTTLVIPVIDSVAPTVTVVPANDATGVAATAPVVWTFNKVIDITKITASNLMLLTDAGVLVAGNLTVDDTNKIVTFTPSSNLAAGTYIAIATSDITSAFGVALEATSITKFTV